MINIDVLKAAILYVGLIVILCWRAYFPWRSLNRNFNRHANYVNLLYWLLGLLYVFNVIVFIFAVHADISATREAPSKISSEVYSKMGWPRLWLRGLVMITPFVVLAILVFCFLQTKQHIREIEEDVAVMQHDRALNIIALPAVYAVMTLSALVCVYKLVAQDAQVESDVTDWEQTKLSAFARYETCFYVADLYEAWALYQFGLLVVEILEESIAAADRSPETPNQPVRGLSATLTIGAISGVMWVGTFLFVAVTSIQAAVSLYCWVVIDPSTKWHQFESLMQQFRYAGMVASAAAIYNVHIVEHTFAEFLGDFYPFTKFLSVKLLVFFAFWQKPVLLLLQWVRILHVSDVQLKLLQSVLLVFECAAGAGLHWWAWSSQEAWYTEKKLDGERQPLVSAARGSAGA